MFMVIVNKLKMETLDVIMVAILQLSTYFVLSWEKPSKY